MPRRHSIAAYVRHLNRHHRKYAEAEDRYNREQPFEQYKYFDQFLSMAVSCEDRGGGFRFGLMSRGQERKFDEAYESLKTDAYEYQLSHHRDSRERHYLNPDHVHSMLSLVARLFVQYLKY